MSLVVSLPEVTGRLTGIGMISNVKIKKGSFKGEKINGLSSF